MARCTCTKTYSCRTCVQTNYCGCRVNPCGDENKAKLPEYNYALDIERNKENIAKNKTAIDALKSGSTSSDVFHKTYDSIEETYGSAKTEDGAEIKYPLKLNAGDTVIYEDCLWENTIKDNETRPDSEEAVGWLNKCTLAEFIICEHQAKTLQFDNCDDMDKYEGTKDCPLEDGMVAYVGATEDGCFEIYMGHWVESDVNQLPDECGSIINVGEGKAKYFQWKSYDECKGYGDRVDALEECCTETKARVKTLEDDVDVLETEMDSAEERLDTLEECCECTKSAVNSLKGIPAGAVTFVSAINGAFAVVNDGDPTYTETNGAGRTIDYYVFNCKEKTFKKDDYPYLATSGKDLVLSGFASIGYYTDFDNQTLRQINPNQWSTLLYIDGERVKEAGDMYGMNKSGNNSGLSDNFSVKTKTTGKDLKVKFCYVMGVDRDKGTEGDTLYVDMGSATITFSANTKDKGEQC